MVMHLFFLSLFFINFFSQQIFCLFPSKKTNKKEEKLQKKTEKEFTDLMICSYYLKHKDDWQKINDHMCFELDLHEQGINDIKNAVPLRKTTVQVKAGKDYKKIIKSFRNKFKLEELNLSHNKIMSIGTVVYLSNLRKLNLSHNLLIGIPVTIAKLRRLTELDLSYNRIKELPSTIGELNALTKLYLHDNQLSQLPPEITKFTSLCELTLENNLFVKIPNFEGILPNLSENYKVRLQRLPSELHFNSPKFSKK